MGVKQVVLVVLFIIAFVAMVFVLPVGVDWQNTYRPAALAVWSGESPFSVEIYYAAPWAVLPLVPLALLPLEVGRAGMFVVGLCAFAFTAFQLGARRWTLVLFLCSAAVVGCLNNGNIEWMPLLGLVLPPQWGLVLLAVKPQVGVGLGVFWFVCIWNERGFWAMVRTFLPVTVLTLVSFVVYGVWVLRFGQTLAWSVDNTSLGWYGMALGWVVLVRAIRKGNARLAMASSPLLAPYVLQFTWSAVLVYLLDSPLELLGVVVLMWVPVVVRAFSY
jgi:hypothetical protein